MERDLPDTDLRYVLLGRVNDAGQVNFNFAMKRFPKTYREKEFYQLPFLCESESLPDGFEIRSFLKEHFLKGSRYIEALFAIPCVNLDPATILSEIEARPYR